MIIWWWRPESIVIVEYLRSKAIVDLLGPSNCKRIVVLCIKAKLDGFHLVFLLVSTFQETTKQRVFNYATYFCWILWFLVKEIIAAEFQLVVAAFCFASWTVIPESSGMGEVDHKYINSALSLFYLLSPLCFRRRISIPLPHSLSLSLSSS